MIIQNLDHKTCYNVRGKEGDENKNINEALDGWMSEFQDLKFSPPKPLVTCK